jgi:hypothetical protein
MTATTRSRGGGGRTFLVGIVLVGVLLTIGALTADTRTGRPFDPASAEPDGTKAMVELVSGFGAAVTVPDRLPRGDDADVAMIFDDPSDEASHDELRRWVRAGHILVVADPSSELVPEADLDPSLTFGSGNQATTAIPRGDCPVEALDDVDEIDPGPREWYRYVDQGTVPMCFITSPGGGFLTAQVEGDGVIIGLAAGTPFTNELLGAVDNAVLATTLLAPRPGYRVALLTDKAFPVSSLDVTGADNLTALISPGVKLLLLELLIALVLLALASGRRLGRPIGEPQPVQIAGSELVEAVGQLLLQRRDPTAAAAVLRSDLRSVAVRRFGIAPDVESRVMAEAIASRTALEPDYVLAVLADQPVGSDTELATLAAHIDLIREEILHGHAP